jgi:hypothetical protein
VVNEWPCWCGQDGCGHAYESPEKRLERQAALAHLLAHLEREREKDWYWETLEFVRAWRGES